MEENNPTSNISMEMDMDDESSSPSHSYYDAMSHSNNGYRFKSNSVSDNGENVSKYVSKAQQAGKYLSLIVHTNECRGNCGSECHTRFRLINHCTTCGNGEFCVIAGCHTTKQLIRHRENCYVEEQAAKALGVEKKECLICAVAYKYLSANGIGNSNGNSNGIGSGIHSTPNSRRSSEISENDNHSHRHPSTPTTITSVPSPYLGSGRRKTIETSVVRTLNSSLSISRSYDPLMERSSLPNMSTLRERYHSADNSLKKDGDFAIPTMLPKRFRCSSATEVELGNSGNNNNSNNSAIGQYNTVESNYFHSVSDTSSGSLRGRLDSI